MAYTRPWAPQEERYLRDWYRGYKSAARLGRELHRTAKAVMDRWKRIRRTTARRQKYLASIQGLLPVGVIMRDPAGKFCAICGQEQQFSTEDGRCVVECRCARRFVPTRSLA